MRNHHRVTPDDGGARQAERIAKPAMHTDFVAPPADASLLRAIATDVEESDSGYVLGGITGERLRKLAAQLDQPAAQALLQLADEIHGEEEIVLVFVETPSGQHTAIGLDAGIRLLTALAESEPTPGAT